MRVLLISANTDTLNMVPLPLGPACVAAATQQAGHDVMLTDLMFEEDGDRAIRQAIESFRPEIIGLSVRNIDDQNMEDCRFLLTSMKAVVDTCRAASPAPIVLGGAGYSIFPDGCLRYLGADYGVQGEGESVFPKMLGRLARGASVLDLPSVYLPGRAPSTRSFVKNLDSLPLPDPRLWIADRPGSRDFWVPVQTRRGCHLDCSYCSTATIEGKHIRARSPEQVTRWLLQLSAAGFHNFNFVDNTFNLPRSYAEDLCRGLIAAEADINWWCIVYPKWVDRRLAELMADAGCRQLSLGFESGSNQVLRCLNKRFSPDEVRTASETFRDVGIERRGFLLLGGPGETRQSVEQSLAFADSLDLDFLKITIGIRIYPHTQLAEIAVADGLVSEEDDLLLPRFYISPHLRDWLPDRVASYRTTRRWAV